MFRFCSVATARRGMFVWWPGKRANARRLLSASTPAVCLQTVRQLFARFGTTNNACWERAHFRTWLAQACFGTRVCIHRARRPIRLRVSPGWVLTHMTTALTASDRE